MSNKKKEFFLVRWFKRCFLGDRPELSDEEEERIQTPVRAMVANFVHRPLAMIGLIVFLAIFVFVMVGPHIWVLDLSEQDSTLTNLPPSNNMMEVPKKLLANGVKDISSGNTYGIGIDNEGELYTWGHTRITDKIDVADIPDEIWCRLPPVRTTSSRWTRTARSMCGATRACSRTSSPTI